MPAKMKEPEKQELKSKVSIICDESKQIADQIQTILDATNGAVTASADELEKVHKLYQILCKKNRQINRMCYQTIGIEMN